MKQQIKVPQIGESVSSGILASWLVAEGASVTEGEELFELETDKATLAVPSPAAGTLHRGAGEGDEVQVGQSVGEIDTEGAGGGPEPASETNAANDSASRADGGTTASDGESGAPSPAARRIAEEAGIHPASITGTGKDGRVTKADAKKAAEEQNTAQDGGGAGTVRTPASSTGDRQERVPMTSLRKRIAENLVHSRQSSAHVTTFNEIDMAQVMEVRKQFRDQFQERHGVKLGFMSFFVKAVVRALERFPEVNAYLDGTDVVYNRFYNIGVALSSEKGLLTPVVKDADAMSFAGVEKTILDFIDRANKRRLTPDELTGATFTISNGGVFGSLLSTPIPSPPQTAILGMHTIQKRPVAIDDQVVIRPMMYVALTYDHRMIDGREAVAFLRTIVELIEDPTAMLLDV